MNADLALLQPYPFEKLNVLLGAITPPKDIEHISLGIGEPKHPAPAVVTSVLNQSVDLVANYPTTKGSAELRDTIAAWCTRRFKLEAGSLTGDNHLLPVMGTREAIFDFTQCAVDRKPGALVFSP